MAKTKEIGCMEQFQQSGNAVLESVAASMADHKYMVGEDIFPYVAGIRGGSVRVTLDNEQRKFFPSQSWDVMYEGSAAKGTLHVLLTSICLESGRFVGHYNLLAPCAEVAPNELVRLHF